MEKSQQEQSFWIKIKENLFFWVIGTTITIILGVATTSYAIGQRVSNIENNFNQMDRRISNVEKAMVDFTDKNDKSHEKILEATMTISTNLSAIKTDIEWLKKNK